MKLALEKPSLEQCKAIANAIAEFDSVDKTGMPVWYQINSMARVNAMETDLTAYLKGEGIPVELIYPDE